jgi:flagellin
MAAGSVGKLASGSRIVKASDDAAGLAIGTRLKADVTALTQAGINASQGASVVQVADGGLARIGDVLQRMKALAAQSLSGVPTNTERGFIDAEYQELRAEITSIAQTTRFNGASLLDGATAAAQAADYFVGTDVSDTITVAFTALSGVDGYTSTALSLSATSDVATITAAQSAMAAIDTAIDTISEARATAGALISRFEFRGQQIATSLENIDAAKSAIMDVDLAAEQSKLVSNQVLVQAAVSAVSQANQIPQSLLRVLQ